MSIAKAWIVAGVLASAGALWSFGSPPQSTTQPASEVPVVFSCGHETDPRDGGRPVLLVAAALGVSSDVFRQAFRGVTPARGGRPPEAPQVRRNKEALLRVLAPYGVTNDRLDEVSNYYRYVPEHGDLWRHAPATATASIRDGVVTGFNITDPGSGYSSAPEISIPSVPGFKAKVDLGFGTDLKTNGSVRSIRIVSDRKTVD